MLREALLYEKLDNDRVQCNLCPRCCILKEGKRGYCGVRQNLGGKIYSLTYGEIASMSINPIEKKPVFHFCPGSRWLSLGSLGCNFRCPGCQNWEIAHAEPGQRGRTTSFLSAEELTSLAKQHDCVGISWTFNEPSLWLEYTLEGAKLAKEQGLFTNYVTNGYITAEALDSIGPYLDIFRVDVKGFSQTSYGSIAHIANFTPILEVTKRAKDRWGMWVEVVTNVIPGYNDKEAELRGIASWIHSELGACTPWHLTRFFPYLKLSHLQPTPTSTLEKAREWAHQEGLHYVYSGNIPGHLAENTYCHHCGKLLIRRNAFDILGYNLERNHCPYCKTLIPGRFYPS